jgi:hypothetical protein
VRGRLVSPDRLKSEFGIDLCNAHRKRLEAAGLFPRRVQITERSHGYIEEELQALIEARIAARDSQAA